MKKAKYKISVIVPVYNKEAYLEQCIDSILSQTYRELELLLIDDASTDSSGAICDRYGERDSRVKVIHQQNGGPTAAAVTGLRHAEGDYCTFVDSDDYISEDMLQKMAACLSGRRGEIVCCNHMLEKRRETVPVLLPLEPGVYEGARLETEIKDKLLGRENRVISMSRCMKLCERSVFEGNEKYYDRKIRLGDDFHLIYPALLAASRIVIMEGALFYHYRYVEDSIVHGYDPGTADSVRRWYRAVRQVVLDRQVPGGEEKLDREYCYMMLYVMKNELRGPGQDYVRRIQEIFLDPEVREKILHTPLSVTGRANALLYLGMQYPNKLLLGILRTAMRRHDRAGRDK